MRDIPINGVPAFIDLRPRARTVKRGFVKRRSALYADRIGLIKCLKKQVAGAQQLAAYAALDVKVTKALAERVATIQNRLHIIDDVNVDRSSPEAVRASLERFAHQACGIKYWYSKSGDLDWGKTPEEARRRGVERYGEPNWRMPLVHEDGKIR